MEEAFAGVDWGCGSHAVCVLDAKGAVLDRFEVGHDREGLAALTARLRRHGAPPVAIERPTASWLIIWWRRARPSCRSTPTR